MFAAPLPLAPPLVGGLTPATNSTAPIRHRLSDSFEDFPLRRQRSHTASPTPAARSPCCGHGTAAHEPGSPEGDVHRTRNARRAFEVDDLQAAIDRVAADGNGRKTRLVMRVLPRLPSDSRFSLGGRPECRTPYGQFDCIRAPFPPAPVSRVPQDPPMKCPMRGRQTGTSHHARVQARASASAADSCAPALDEQRVRRTRLLWRE
jgi:hypothetical protein